MERMIFNETNIFILSKMAAIVRQKIGRKHRLSSESEIIELLHEVTEQNDQRLLAYYGRFLENLTPEQVVYLAENGVSIPEQYMKKPGLFPTPIPRQYAYIPNQMTK